MTDYLGLEVKPGDVVAKAHAGSFIPYLVCRTTEKAIIVVKNRWKWSDTLKMGIIIPVEYRIKSENCIIANSKLPFIEKGHREFYEQNYLQTPKTIF